MIKYKKKTISIHPLTRICQSDAKYAFSSNSGLSLDKAVSLTVQCVIVANKKIFESLFQFHRFYA